MLEILRLEKSYKRLFFAGVINGVGDRFSQVALLALILHLTGSGVSVGLTLALRLIPFLLFGPFSSRAASKFTRKKLLVFTDVTRAIIALSFLWINSADDLWIAYAGSFLMASGEAFYSPARKASIPAIVKEENLKSINSWEQVLLGFVLIIGALSGGIVAFFFGAKAAFLVNVVSFLGAGLLISGIPKLEKEESKANDAIVGQPQIKFLPLVMSSAFLMVMLSFEFIIPAINGIENVLLSVYAVETFQAADLGVGILYSVLGTGFLISPLITKHIHHRYLEVAFLCIAMEGVFLSIISQVGSFTTAVILFGILTIFGGVGNTLFDTAVMETIPSKWHGFYYGMTATIANTCLGISMFVTGFLLDVFTPRTMGLMGGLLYIGFGILYYLASFAINLRHERVKLAGNESIIK